MSSLSHIDTESLQHRRPSEGSRTDMFAWNWSFTMPTRAINGDIKGRTSEHGGQRNPKEQPCTPEQAERNLGATGHMSCTLWRRNILRQVSCRRPSTASVTETKESDESLDPQVTSGDPRVNLRQCRQKTRTFTKPELVKMTSTQMKQGIHNKKIAPHDMRHHLKLKKKSWTPWLRKARNIAKQLGNLPRSRGATWLRGHH